MNGNSVNFSEDANTLHSEYDSKPVEEYDSSIRRGIKDWNNPNGDTVGRTDYFDIRESEDEANRRISR